MSRRRPYAASLLASAAALALGFGVGAGPVAQDSVSDSTADRARLRDQVAGLTEDTLRLRARSTIDAQVLRALARPLVADRLADRTVAVVVAPQVARADVRRTKAALSGAGAEVVSTLMLTDTFVDPAKARSPLEDLALRLVPPGVEFAEGATAIQRVGTVLARSVVQRPDDGRSADRGIDQDAAEVIAGLTELAALRLDGKPGVRAELAVVLAPSSSPDSAKGALTGLVAALDAGSRGTVVVAPGDAGEGLLRWVRDAVVPGLAEVSSVDGGTAPAGQVAMVLALAEQLADGSGAYGAGRRAGSVVPDLRPPADRVASTASPTG